MNHPQYWHKKRSKLILFWIIFLIILAYPSPKTICAQSPDEFPVGLFLEYTITERDIDDTILSRYNMTYIIESWVSEENVAIIEIFNTSDFYFHDIAFPEGFESWFANERMWYDVSSWSPSTNVTLSSFEYMITDIEPRIIPSGTFNCFHLFHQEYYGTDLYIDFELYYHSDSGILIETEQNYWNSSNPSVSFTNTSILNETNFYTYSDYEIHRPEFTDTSTSPTTTTNPTTVDINEFPYGLYLYYERTYIQYQTPLINNSYSIEFEVVDRIEGYLDRFKVKMIVTRDTLTAVSYYYSDYPLCNISVHETAPLWIDLQSFASLETVAFGPRDYNVTSHSNDGCNLKHEIGDDIDTVVYDSHGIFKSGNYTHYDSLNPENTIIIQTNLMHFRIGPGPTLVPPPPSIDWTITGILLIGIVAEVIIIRELLLRRP